MARLQQGILGGISKKIGNVVGASWKGIPVLRIYQPNVANPKTTSQTAQRNAFKQNVDWASALLATIIKPLWDRFAVRESGYNAFIQAQKRASGGLNNVMDNIVMSKGKMEAPGFTSKTITSTSLTVVWPTTTTGRFESSTDKCFIVYGEDYNGKVKGFNTNVARSVGQAVCDIEDVYNAGGDQYVWLMFMRADGTVVSNPSKVV